MDLVLSVMASSTLFSSSSKVNGSGSTKTAVFAKEYPERFFNMGIAEQNMYGAAAGLALRASQRGFQSRKGAD